MPTYIWGYYNQDSRSMQREGDFLILGPAGGLLVLEVKSSLPRHFPETGRWEGAGGDNPISQLNTEWQGVIHGIRAKGNPPFIEKALCVPGIDAPTNVENFQGIPRSWLVTGNDLENWVSTWLRIFGNHVRSPVDPLQRRAVLEAFGQGSIPEEKRAFVDHTEQLFERQFTSRFALLDQLSENRQLLIHGGTGTGKTWHALELAFRHARQGNGQRVLFLTYNKALTAQLRRIVALRQIERGEVLVSGWEELFLELCYPRGKVWRLASVRQHHGIHPRLLRSGTPRLVLEISPRTSSPKSLAMLRCPDRGRRSGSRHLLARGNRNPPK